MKNIIRQSCAKHCVCPTVGEMCRACRYGCSCKEAGSFISELEGVFRSWKPKNRHERRRARAVDKKSRGR